MGPVLRGAERSIYGPVLAPPYDEQSLIGMSYVNVYNMATPTRSLSAQTALEKHSARMLLDASG
jgi:hypothetical protein